MLVGHTIQMVSREGDAQREEKSLIVSEEAVQLCTGTHTVLLCCSPVIWIILGLNGRKSKTSHVVSMVGLT